MKILVQKEKSGISRAGEISRRRAHPASCTVSTVSLLGVKSGRGVTLTPHPLLVPWSRKGIAIPLLPLWAALPVQSLSACTRVHFTFICIVITVFHTCFDLGRSWSGLAFYTCNINKSANNNRFYIQYYGNNNFISGEIKIKTPYSSLVC